MTAPNPATAMARVLVDEWVRCGVTDAVVAPGSRSAALVFACAHADLRVHVQVDERSAGFLALGLARASRRPTVVVTTSGTATVNLHPAVTEADRSAVPLIVATADRPPELRDIDANQTIRQTGIYGPSPRWEVDLGVAEDRADAPRYWRSTACRVYAEATGLGGAPGPVHVNVPFREPTVPAADDGRSRSHGFTQAIDGRPDARSWTDVTVSPRALEDEEVGALARELDGVERGVIVVGDGAPDSEALHGLAESLGWPVLAEALSGTRDRESVVASYHHLLGAPVFASAHGPDLILRFGRAGLSRNLLSFLSGDAPQIAVLPDRRWSDPARATTQLVVAEPTRLCAALAGRVASPGGGGWRDSWLEADRLATAAIEELLAADGISEPSAARTCVRAAPDGAALVVGSSMPVRDLDAFMAPRGGLTIYGNRGASGIDGFVSTTLGVALAHDGPTIALAGDLSLLHDANGFLLDPGGDPGDVTFVVVNNDGGGIFHFLPQAGYPEQLERFFATPHGRSFADLAAFHGIGHDLVTDPQELADLVGAPDSVRLVEIRTDREDNVALHRRIDDAVRAALTA